MESNRRDFLRQAGALAATAAATAPLPLLAAPASRQPPTLVAVYLRGGADAISTIVPHADKNYATLRPTMAVPGPDGSGSDAALALDDRVSLNPNMKALHALYQKGQCAPIVCVGSPHPTRSHFDAQDFMERGAPGLRTVTSGWLNRFLIETRSSRDAQLRAFAPQPLLPRSLRGTYPVLARPDQQAQQALAVYSNIYGSKSTGMTADPAKEPTGRQTRQVIQSLGARTISELRELDAVLAGAAPTKAKYPASGFGRQMRDIAKVIKSNRGLEVTALDYLGWDHHIDAGPIDGQLGKKLADVSDTLGAFVEDLGPRMDRVLVLVMSEFGRAAKENGNRGTDHGHGGFMLAVGGPVVGKAVYGKWEGLAPDKLYQQRDLAVTTDFRIVFSEVLRAVFGYDAAKAGMFPEYTSDAPPLDFLRKV